MEPTPTVTSIFCKAEGKIKDLINYGGEKPAKKQDGVFNRNTKSLLKKVDN